MTFDLRTSLFLLGTSFLHALTKDTFSNASDIDHCVCVPCPKNASLQVCFQTDLLLNRRCWDSLQCQTLNQKCFRTDGDFILDQLELLQNLSESDNQGNLCHCSHAFFPDAGKCVIRLVGTDCGTIHECFSSNQIAVCGRQKQYLQKTTDCDSLDAPSRHFWFGILLSLLFTMFSGSVSDSFVNVKGLTMFSGAVSDSFVKGLTMFSTVNRLSFILYHEMIHHHRTRFAYNRIWMNTYCQRTMTWIWRTWNDWRPRLSRNHWNLCNRNLWTEIYATGIYATGILTLTLFSLLKNLIQTLVQFFLSILKTIWPFEGSIYFQHFLRYATPDQSCLWCHGLGTIGKFQYSFRLVHHQTTWFDHFFVLYNN